MGAGSVHIDCSVVQHEALVCAPAALFGMCWVVEVPSIEGMWKNCQTKWRTGWEESDPNGVGQQNMGGWGGGRKTVLKNSGVLLK